MIELHWTREEVLDQVDALFLEDLNRAWADAPPLRKMVAAYFGLKAKTQSKSQSKTQGKARPSRNYAELLALFPRGHIT